LGSRASSDLIVTHDDIDTGGVVNPALTHDNTTTATTGEGVSDSGSASVSIVQNPDVTLVKSASVGDGTAEPCRRRDQLCDRRDQ